ncbi:MAG: aminopeptidase P family N-terminal domain-containing protein [Oscillospiraceae bacterium]|nr:aminopeptidase P family N-terminal domain-containing protein [Oscillospiraceae bacterium]
MIRERISCLQNLLKEKNISAVIIPTDDFHMSEYVGDYFKARNYFSGFTGSAGVMVVAQDEANLWVDGRYFIQAERQLENTGIIQRNIGEPGVPTIEEYILDKVGEGEVLAFDGRVISYNSGKFYAEELGKKGARIHTEEDIPGILWKDRPAMSAEKAYVLPVEFSGKTVQDKLGDVRAVMAEKGTDVHVITSLDDIAWLYNIRGNDVLCTPVVLSYAVVTMDKAYIFANPSVFDEDVMAHLTASGVEVKPYEEVYSFVKGFDKETKVLIDTAHSNYAIVSSISAEVVSAPNPEMEMKAVKNPVEVENYRISHIQDGVAVTKFMYWLKKNAGKIPMTEYTAQEYLSQLRYERPNNLGLSFTPISGYKENAAMMHYSAKPETAKEITNEGMLLVDSGGHYWEGSTDITRTFVLGPISDEIKEHYTAVVRGVIGVSKAKFLHGCIGMALDVLARGPIWDLDLDYKCGSGHGIGYLLNVHEGPQGFRWRKLPGRNESAVFAEGMITTIEPGIYIEGSHGIRVENEILCKKGAYNEYGQFMEFETITFAPIDLDGVDPKYMTKAEVEWLNNYHAQVYEKISPYLTAEEAEWLKEYTRAI